MVGALACAWPLLCFAEPGSAWFRFTLTEIFVVAAILAVPSAAACAASELIAPRKRVGLPIGIAAGVLALLGAAIALKAARTPAISGAWFFWFAVPPLATLALRAMFSAAPHRLGAGWAIAFAALGVAHMRVADAELLAELYGGAAACLLPWSVSLGWLWMRGIEVEAPRSRRSEIRGADAAFGRLAGKLRGASEPLLAGAERALQPAQTGLSWWFGAAAVLYFGIGIALMSGKSSLAMAIFGEMQQTVDLLGWALPRATASRLWWLLGLPWSLIAGSAIWGLAGTFGAFDPGRARAARFAAIIFGSALLIWTALMTAEMRVVMAREEQAAGLYR
jgi:hypothetical protein